MKLLLSFDYELFFGSPTGDPRRCLIEPVDTLLSRISHFPVRLSLFVDAGFLVALEEAAKKFSQPASDLDAVRGHLSSLKEKGHDIQLHVHPHWLDSYYDGRKWQLDTRRYRLHDFNEKERDSIIHEYTSVLTSIAGNTVFAFRGGGWCIQPWKDIAPSLQRQNIWLESTVFYRGVSEDRQRWYDFTSVPDLDFWRFDSDPAVESANGYFLEVPISSVKIGPLFFWKMALLKKFAERKMRPFGNGRAMRADSSYYLRRLTRSSRSVVSMDGLKAGLLSVALRDNLKRRPAMNLFHVMGHPKALSEYSIDQLDHFLKKNDFEFITYQDLGYLRNE